MGTLLHSLPWPIFVLVCIVVVAAPVLGSEVGKRIRRGRQR